MCHALLTARLSYYMYMSDRRYHDDDTDSRLCFFISQRRAHTTEVSGVARRTKR